MDFSSSDPTRKQIAVATYLIDRLALRAGNEKVNLRIFVPWSL
jgi:DNA topoisomerase-1